MNGSARSIPAEPGSPRARRPGPRLATPEEMELRREEDLLRDERDLHEDFRARAIPPGAQRRLGL
ncbi:hypothetical protein V6P99_37510 [Streptomyces virginiae]|uniref:hypothetical protein n=1 Tax=Streptomyces virginiae TaxID=1961 RepID=UPI0030D0703E